MKLLIYILLFLLSNFAKAEDKTKAIDLKAAYCIKVHKDVLSIISSNLKNDEESLYLNPKNDSEIQFNQSTIKFNDERKENIENIKYIIERLENYLNPRLKHIDKLAIAAAINQVKKDIAITESCIKNNKCNIGNTIEQYKQYEICAAECKKKNGFINKKIEECDDLSWLPY